jgi:ribosomal protein S18 acetylase RimI-like enzyme
MLQTRKAVPEDRALIAAHRKAMFLAMGDTEETVLDTMRRNCVPWLERMMVEGKYFGWITYVDDSPVASAGLLLQDWPPGPSDPVGELRGYLLNVFVATEFRRRGLARQLVEVCMAEARRRGIRVMSLHASNEGRPLYDKLGFSSTNEMQYREAKSNRLE